MKTLNKDTMIKFFEDEILSIYDEIDSGSLNQTQVRVALTKIQTLSILKGQIKEEFV